MNGLAVLEATLYCRRDMEGVELHHFDGGLVAVFTTRCPGKQTPNEDSAGIITIDDRSGVFIVADGLGGARSEELASGTVVEALRASIEQSTRDNGMLRTEILDGIETGNRLICETGIGAATILAVVEVHGRTVRPFHVGDSMILVVGQRGKIKLQTVSHSPVGFAVEAGMLDENDALHHQDRHLFSNVVGIQEIRIEIGSVLNLAPRDTLLLASDGLLDNLHLEEIVDRIRIGPLDQALGRLVKDSLQRMIHSAGGQPSKPDDLTVIAFRPAISRANSSRL